MITTSSVDVGLDCKSFLRTRYTPHLLYADYEEFNVEQEPDNLSITDICTEFREALERYVASQAAKIDTEPESEAEPEPESEVEPESEPAVVNELKPEPEIEELLVETSVDLAAELSIELVPSTPAGGFPYP